jgi:hypothetical protein
VPSSGAAALGRCRRRVRSSPHGRRRGRPGALPERAPARAGHRGRGLASVPVRRWPQRAPHVLPPDMPGDPLRAATRAVGQRDGPPHGSRAATVCGVIRAGRVTCRGAGRRVWRGARASCGSRRQRQRGSAAIGTATSMEWGRPVACRAVTPGVISPRRWSGYSLRRSPTLAPLARTVPPCRPSPAVTPAVRAAPSDAMPRCRRPFTPTSTQRAMRSGSAPASMSRAAASRWAPVSIRVDQAPASTEAR